VLIERAQFAHNKKIYESGAFKDQLTWEGSWLEWFLFETESFHGELRASGERSPGDLFGSAGDPLSSSIAP
jgi:hypothetical protein